MNSMLVSYVRFKTLITKLKHLECSTAVWLQKNQEQHLIIRHPFRGNLTPFRWVFFASSGHPKLKRSNLQDRERKSISVLTPWNTTLFQRINSLLIVCKLRFVSSCYRGRKNRSFVSKLVSSGKHWWWLLIFNFSLSGTPRGFNMAWNLSRS